MNNTETRTWLAICDAIRADFNEGKLAPESMVNDDTTAPQARKIEFEKATTLLTDLGILTRSTDGGLTVSEHRARIVRTITSVTAHLRK